MAGTGAGNTRKVVNVDCVGESKSKERERERERGGGTIDQQNCPMFDKERHDRIKRTRVV
jgi:hypothetical protein